MVRRFLTSEQIGSAEPEELAVWFMPLAEAYAHRVRPGCEDTRGDAYVGLVRAAEMYDSTQGPFVPYATLWIRQSVRRGASGHRNAVWLPPQIRERLAEMLEMQNKLGRNVSDADLAEALGRGWTVEEIGRLRSAARSVPMHVLAPKRSMDDYADYDSDSDRVSGSLLASVDDDTEAVDARLDLEAIIGTLPDDIAETAKRWLSDPDGRRMRMVAEQIRSYLDGEHLI